jgi:hypothetical protein
MHRRKTAEPDVSGPPSEVKGISHEAIYRNPTTPYLLQKQLFDAQLAAVAAQQAATAEIKKQSKQDVLVYYRRLPDCPDHALDRHRTADE